MSYILDALKKVEHEKLKKSAPGTMTSIAGDLFQEQIRRPTTGGRWKIVLMLTVASLVTFTGTWFLLRDNKQKSAPVLVSAVSSAVRSDVAIPVVPIAVPAPVQPLPVTVPVAKAVAPTASTEPLPITEESVEEDRSARSIKRQSKQSFQAVPPTTLKPAHQMIQPPADIKLSGIAWQDERSARRAVVNGFLLKEGSVVSGARIIEIVADRVRFASSGGTFEIRLDAVSATEARR